MSDTTAQLQVLIERLNAGDAAARKELIGHACERLRRLTRKLLDDFPWVRHFEQTDDVLQYMLLRLMRRLQAVTVPTVAEFFALAARETRRELIDLARHYYGPQGPGNREVPMGKEDSSAVSTPPGGPRPETTDEPVRLAVWSEFHAQVEALPEEERGVFDLHWYQGLTLADTAAMLGVSRATVKRRWLAARLRLQAALKGEPIDW